MEPNELSREMELQDITCELPENGNFLDCGTVEESSTKQNETKSKNECLMLQNVEKCDMKNGPILQKLSSHNCNNT